MNDLHVGTLIVYNNAPQEVLEAHHVKMQQRRPVMQTRLRNLVTGNVISITFQTHSKIEPAEVERKDIVFLYAHRGEYVFRHPDDKAKRFTLSEKVIGDRAPYLKSNMTLQALVFNNEIISLEVPIKMKFKVIEAPPNFKGNTATGGYKEVVLETGLKVKAPMFVNVGDVLLINTKTGQYVERA